MEEKGTFLENGREGFIGTVLREFVLFFAVLFFTCVIGIIELLPEFDRIDGIFGWISISALYFGLLGGIIFSVGMCFNLYEENKRIAGEYGFRFPTIERLHMKGLNVKWFLIVGISLVFAMLYFVKTGLLK